MWLRRFLPVQAKRSLWKNRTKTRLNIHIYQRKYSTPLCPFLWQQKRTQSTESVPMNENPETERTAGVRRQKWNRNSRTISAGRVGWQENGSIAGAALTACHSIPGDQSSDWSPLKILSNSSWGSRLWQCDTTGFIKRLDCWLTYLVPDLYRMAYI